MRSYLTFVFAAFALFVVAKADQVPEKLKQAVQTCKASENLDSLDGLKTNKAATTKEEKCFIGCLLKDMKMLSAEGQYDVSGAKEVINHCEQLKDKSDERNSALRVAEECGKRVTNCDDYCECGVLAMGCLLKGMEILGFQESFARMDKLLQSLDA